MAGKKNRSGRKPKLTPELQEKFCKYLASGLTKKGAADAVCITETTLYAWINQGQADQDKGKETIYSKFLESVKQAEARFKLTHIKNIKTAGDSGNWQASAWLLERCYRDEYGRATMDVNLGGQKSGEPIEVKETVQIYLPANGRD